MNQGPKGIHIALGYLCWILGMVLGFLVLVSSRELGLAVLALCEADLRLVALIDKIGFFGFGAVGLAIIVLVEGYFRTGVRRGLLAERVGLVFGVGLLLLFVLDAARIIMPGLVAAARPGVIQTSMSFVIGGLCAGFYWRRRRSRLR